MSLFNLINKSIDKWGSTFKITENGKTVAYKGFVQPLRYKNNMYLGGERLDAGFFDGGHYLFITKGDAGITAHSSAIIEDANTKYAVKRAELFSLQDKNIYTWAILKPYFPPMEEDFGNDRD